MSKRRTTLEKNIQRAIEIELGAEPDLLILKNSIGLARYANETDGKEFFVPYGLGDGSPDLVCLLRITVSPRPIAIWFCLEVKPPEGDLEDDQKKCHEIWRRFGAFIATVRSPAEARAALQRARRLEA